MSLIDLLAWWNLIFELPFALGVSYLGLMSIGLVGDGDADVDLDAEADVDVDVDVDVDADFDHDVEVDHGIHHDLSIDQDIEFDHDHDIDGFDHEASALLRAASILGVGKVPLSLVFITLCFTWGFFGWSSNFILRDLFPVSLFAPISIVIAAFGTLVTTRAFSSIMAHIIPGTTSGAIPKHGLIESTGEALSEINGERGRAYVRDASGNLRMVFCITDGGEVIPLGAEVILKEYLREQDKYVVVAEPFGELERRALEGKKQVSRPEGERDVR